MTIRMLLAGLVVSTGLGTTMKGADAPGRSKADEATRVGPGSVAFVAAEYDLRAENEETTAHGEWRAPAAPVADEVR